MKVIFVLFLLSSSSVGLAQSVDYDKIILPDHVTAAEFEEKLVRLAWKNYPENRIAGIEHSRAQNQLNKSNWNWLNRVTISGNLNEFTINPESNERSEFYPRYNFNVSIPLGILFDQVNDTKISRANLAIEDEQTKQLMLNLRTEVLIRYETYVRNVEVEKVKSGMNNEIKRRYDEAKKKFSDGEINMDEYNVIEAAYGRSVEESILLKSNSKVAKLKVEELIGVKLEEVL